MSLNSYIIGNDLHLFYFDNLKNYNLSETEAPIKFENWKDGFLACVTINAKGEMQKYNLCGLNWLKTNFKISKFVDGERNNLIFTGRDEVKKINVLYSIETK